MKQLPLLFKSTLENKLWRLYAEQKKMLGSNIRIKSAWEVWFKLHSHRAKDLYLDSNTHAIKIIWKKGN